MELDVIRLRVVPIPAETDENEWYPEDGNHVQIFANGRELTSRGAGLGMDPFELLIPENRLIATDVPRKVSVARCTCGELECDATTVVIVREGDRVRWEWGEVDPPVGRPLVFEAGQYEAEMSRISADRSWEGPADTAGRLVLDYADLTRLADWDLTFYWSGLSSAAGESYQVSLGLGADAKGWPKYQITLSVPWSGDPEATAREVAQLLARAPASWTALVSPTKRKLPRLPEIAGPNWRTR